MSIVAILDRIVATTNYRDKLPDLWHKYGLEKDGFGFREEWKLTCRCHWWVVHYLETHPKIVAEYEPNQTGKMKYCDVLDLAEEEHGLFVAHDINWDLLGWKWTDSYIEQRKKRIESKQ